MFFFDWGNDIGQCSRPQTFFQLMNAGAPMIMEIRRFFFHRCRSPLIAKIAPLIAKKNIGPPLLARQKDKKRESSCRSMLSSLNKVEDDGTECLFFV